MTKESTDKEYRLGGYRLREEGDQMWWSTWASLSDSDNEPLDVLHGKCWLYQEVSLLILGSYKIRDGSDFHDYKGVEKYLDSLPKWERTKYYIKFGDIGNSPVMICDTDKPASDDIQKSLREWWKQQELATKA